MSDVDDFILTALEASLLFSPRDHGLSRDEILEAAGRAGFRPGETSDAIGRLQTQTRWGDSKIRVTRLGPTKLSCDFNHVMDPEYRDINAFEFVRRELQALAAEVGEAAAQLPRDVLVERGIAAGIQREALEVAITVTVLDEVLEEKNGKIGHVRGRLNWILPSRQRESHVSGRDWVVKRKWLVTAYPVIQDVISRRTDGRPSASNPLDAFESQLGVLGQERFRAWWVQKRHELRTLDTSLHPVAVTVLAAALAEAALTFIVPRARAHGLMKVLDINKPRSWKFVDLVKGARSSDPNILAILDERAAQRCLDLNDARQRIHAGFLIDSPRPGPIPDLRPEQARDAIQTTDLLVRKILEWLAQSSTKSDPS